MTDNPLILVGAIATAHGVRGQVKIRSFTANPEDIASYSPLTDKAGTRIFGIRIVGEAKDMLIATIEGVTTKDAADALRGTQLYAPPVAMPPLHVNEFYARDLIGMDVKNEDGSLFGKIKEFHDFGAGQLVEIDLAGNDRSELLHFSSDIFPVIDTAKKIITIHPPEYITADESNT